jgi:hypothetical protein
MLRVAKKNSKISTEYAEKRAAPCNLIGALMGMGAAKPVKLTSNPVSQRRSLLPRNRMTEVDPDFGTG